MSENSSGTEAQSIRLARELDYLDVALEDAKLLAGRRKILAAREDEEHAYELRWRDELRPLEIRQEYWRRAFLSACEAFLFRGDSPEDARAKAEEHANIVAGAENKP